MLPRKAVTRSGRGFRKRIPSTKLNRMVECESILEGDAALLLEYSPGVLSYQEQPTRIQYWDGERMRTYVPDFEVRLLDGARIHLEVKHSRDLAKPKIAEKYRAIAMHYQQTPVLFRIVTELECRREPLRTNLRRFSYLRTKALTETLPSSAELTRFLGERPMPLKDVERALGGGIAHRLLAHGFLSCDLAAEIAPNTLITLVKGGCHATLLI